MMDIRERLQALSLHKTDKFAPLVLLLLILALCWKLASVFWWVIAPPQLIQPEQVVPGSQQQQIPNIFSFSLFQEQNANANAADDSIQMQLQGVVISSPARLSTAVIKVGEVAERYQVGNTIAGTSYQLSEVYWDHVVLTQGNGTVREVKFSSLEMNQPIVDEQAAPSQEMAPVMPSTPPPVSQEQGAINQAIQQINEDREAYLKNMGVNAGGGQGYEVTDQTPSALKNKLGLRAGDRVISLNGQPVGQGVSDAQLLERARREGKVKIEIQRGDQVMTVQQSL